MEGEFQIMAEMIRIVADDKIPFLRGGLENVSSMVYRPGGDISREDVRDADVLITRTRTLCNRELLEGSQLKYIASATIGFDHIDREYCQKAGIAWTNAPGCNSSSVEQYLISSLLYLSNLRKLDLSALTLGVVGVGNVGSKVVRAGKALGMQVVMNDPPRQRAEGGGDFIHLQELLVGADIVSLHVPLNRGGQDNTFHLVDRDFIGRMKRGAVLINTSRGPVADEKSVLKGIREDRLSDVILDVFENEPQINPELLDAITLATPHIAGYSLDGKANGTAMAVQAVSRHFQLGMDEWIPGDIPLPAQAELLGDASAETPSTLLWDLYRQTYDIGEDNRRLREAPGSFERLRGEYPFRREPTAYSVRLFQGYPEISEVLENLGFSVLSDYCA